MFGAEQQMMMGGGASAGFTGAEEELLGFAQRCGVTENDIDFILQIPAELRKTIFSNFDPTGTKDGNVVGRLQGYCRTLLRRAGLDIKNDATGTVLIETLSEPLLQQQQQQHHQQQQHSQAFQMQQAMPQFQGSMPQQAMPQVAVNPMVRDWIAQLGLGENAVTFISGFTPDLQQAVMQGFDPSGTKDGNVWGRLLGYARGLWSRRLALPEPASGLIRGLPDEIQVKIMMTFEPGTSKDGNVSARLISFAKQMAARGGQPVSLVGSASPGGYGAGTSLAHPQVRHLGGAGLAGPPSPASAATVAGMAQFGMSMGLEPNATDFLQRLPENVQTTVMTSFDPSGTKDGNVWGRLFAFARRTWAKAMNVDRASFDSLRTMPEDDQIRTIIEWPSSGMQQHMLPQQHAQLLTPSMGMGGMGGHHHNPRSVRDDRPEPVPPRANEGPCNENALAEFGMRWSLDERGSLFVRRLPQAVREHVFTNFDGSSGTDLAMDLNEDGTIWGRLLAFTQDIWARSLGLDHASIGFIKELPEDAQMICMTDFEPSGTKDGNVIGRLQGFAKKALAQASQGPYGTVDPSSGNRGRRRSTVSNVYATPSIPLIRTPVAANGAAFATSLNAANGNGAQRPELMDFMQRCNLDMSSLPFLESIPEDILPILLTEFDPSGTKDGNVLGRLQGYVRLLNARQQKRRAEDPMGGPPPVRMRFS